MYIDTLAELLDNVPRRISSLPSNLFADDVALMAKSLEGLQYLLDICTQWADSFGMIWAPGKSKVLCPAEPEQAVLLAGSSLQRAESTKYLGVEVDCRGINGSAADKRLKAAKRRVNELRGIGLLGRLYLKRAARNYEALVRPVRKYGIHLSPLTQAQRHAAEQVEAAASPIPIKLKSSKARGRVRTIWESQMY